MDKDMWALVIGFILLMALVGLVLILVLGVGVGGEGVTGGLIFETLWEAIKDWAGRLIPV